MKTIVYKEFSPFVFAEPQSGIAEKSLRFSVEFGLYFILCEGLLRRFMPSMGIPILAFKFLYFPILYIFFLLFTKNIGILLKIPLEIRLFIVWGIVISIPNFLTFPITTFIGVFVNIIFVPVSCLSFFLYSDRKALSNVLYRLTIFTGITGVLAIYQYTLPPTHWMNMGTDMFTSGIDDRIASTFQFCNIFGSYGIGGSITCMGSFYMAQNNRNRIVSFLCLFLLFIGITCSGSRAGGYGILSILAIVLIYSKIRFRIHFIIILFIIAAMISGTKDIKEYLTDRAASRSLEFYDIYERSMNLYMGELFLYAWDESKVVGVGWGPYTTSVSNYSAKWERLQNLTDITGKMEGGYPLIMLEVGLPGLILFLYMHRSFFLRRKKSLLPWMGFAVGTWSLLGNLPILLQEVSVLAIYWWFLVGLSWIIPNMSETSS